MNKLLSLFGYTIFMALALALGVVQSTFWSQYISFLPEPQFWVVFLTYWGLYKSLNQSITFSFLLSIVLLPLTGMSLFFLFANMIFLTILIWFIKVRFFQSGPLFFMLTAAFFTFCATPLRLLLSWVIQSNPIQEIYFFSLLLSPLLTALLALPLLMLFKAVEGLTFNKINTEFESNYL